MNIEQPTPGRVSIPEFCETNPVQATVIVPQPAQSTKVVWNEFPEEPEIQLGPAPRVRTHDWVPINQVMLHHCQHVQEEEVLPVRSYRPGKIDRVWPPPSAENENAMYENNEKNTYALI